jgi:hypothetical protein
MMQDYKDLRSAPRVRLAMEAYPAAPQPVSPPPHCYREEKMPMQRVWCCEMTYPEIFYKVQPFIMLACAQIDSYGSALTCEMLDQMGDGVYHDVCHIYPEMAEYGRSQESGASNMPMASVQFGRSPGGRFRRRGLLRDLIDILILYELFGRRRFF